MSKAFIYSGLPGSGKSYKAVYDIINTYQFTHFIVHNLDDFKPSVLKFPGHCIDWKRKFVDSGQVKIGDFFKYDFQKKLCSSIKRRFNKPILFIIEEASDYFLFQNNSYLDWLKMHRHLGQDVLFITQDSKNIHYTYRRITSYEVRAKADIKIAFLYSKLIADQQVALIYALKRKKYFKAYKSYDIEGVKRRSYGIYILVGLVILAFYTMRTLPGKSLRKAGHDKNLAHASVKNSSSVNQDLPPVFSSARPDPVAARYSYSGCALVYNGGLLNGQKSRFYVYDSVLNREFDYKEIYPEYSIRNKTENTLILTDPKTRKDIVLFSINRNHDESQFAKQDKEYER